MAHLLHKIRSMFRSATGPQQEKGEVHDIVKKIFGAEFLLQETDEPARELGSQRSKYIGHVRDNLSKILDSKTAKSFTDRGAKKLVVDAVADDSRPGRIGPKIVVFDATSGTGRMMLVGDERVSVQGLSNFATIRASACVYSGRWMYEFQLGTEGVMQIGWCTHSCLFSTDAGVGDTAHSYAYDGARVRRWNVTTSHYGQHWLAGDLIACCIDLDKGTIEYYRNGVSLGMAFESVHRGAGVAYFPAVSLAMHEHLCANFGQRPFVYPVEGYSPLQLKPRRECARAALLLDSLDVVIVEALALEGYKHSAAPQQADGRKTEKIVIKEMVPTRSMTINNAAQEDGMSRKAFLMSLARIIISELSAMIRISYVVVAELLPRVHATLGLPAHSTHHVPDARAASFYYAIMLENFTGTSEALRCAPHKRLCRLLDWLWSFADESLVCDVLEHCVVRESLLFDNVSQDMSFSRQQECVYTLCGLLQHAVTRRHLVKYVLFGKVMFDSFLQMKCPEEAALRAAVRHGWWRRPLSVSGETDPRLNDSQLAYGVETGGPPVKTSPSLKGSKPKAPTFNSNDENLERQYKEDCEKISTAIAPLEQIQVEFLLMLLDNRDGTDVTPSTCKIFLEKFRRYIMDNCILDMRIFSISRNSAAISWFCHARLLTVVLRLWEIYPLGSPGIAPHVPPRAFIDGSLDFYNVDRLGGVLPFLVRTLRTELVAVLGENNAFVQSFEPRYNVGGGVDTGVSGGTIDLSVGSPALATLPQVISSIARFMNAANVSSPNNNRPGVDTSSGVKGARSAMASGGSADPRIIMLLLLDGLTAMFHSTAVKHAEKLSEFRDQQADLADCLHDVEQRLAGVTAELRAASHKDLTENEKMKKLIMQEILKELGRTKDVYEEKLSSGALQQAWVSGAVWTRRRQAELAREYSGALHTMRLASDKQYAAQTQERSREVLPEKSSLITNQGLTENSYASLQLRYESSEDHSPDAFVSAVSTPFGSQPVIGHSNGSERFFPTELFPFVPDYYLEASLELGNTLRLFMHPTIPTKLIPDWEELLVGCASLLCLETADSRIILASVRDSLVQTLASFATETRTVRALEAVPAHIQTVLIEELLRPYANRSWAQSNWVLVRFWHGSGFGYRHRQWPHLAARFGDREPTVNNLGAKVDAALMSQCFGPCPSELIQTRIAEYLIAHPDSASLFLHSLLNQLHWAFSEFVNLMQEIERVSSDSDLDVRQTKLCATCFDLYHSLCRALEMSLHLAPLTLTQPSAAAPDLLLTRTCQMLMSVLARVCSRAGGGAAFARMTSRGLPDTDRVHYYVALAPVAGCLVQLMSPDQPPDHQLKVTRALVTEPLFQLQHVEFMLGRKNDDVFSFYHYPDDVNATELAALESVVERMASARDALRARSETSSVSRSDLLCTICYARLADTVFLPCKHHSCRSCIQQHMLNSKQCFFCKADIDSVIDMEPEERANI